MTKQTKKSQAKSSSPRAAKSKAAPVSVSRSTVGKDPRISQTKRSCRIRHRELFTDVVTAVSFSPVLIPINPGMSTMFPWLHDVANRWEMYCFHSLSFEYVPSCPTSTPGRMTMAIDFDALDGAPADKFALSAYSGASACSIWDHMKITVPPGRLSLGMAQRYTRRGLHEDLDLKTYDLGNLVYGLNQEYSDVDLVGEIWVEYDVELFIPQIRSTAVSDSFISRKVVPAGGVFSSPDGAFEHTGTGVLKPVKSTSALWDPTGNVFVVLDDFNGLLSLTAKNITAFTGSPTLDVSVLKQSSRGSSSVTQILSDLIGSAPTATAVKDFLVSLRRGAELVLTKATATALTGIALKLMAADPAVIQDIKSY